MAGSELHYYTHLPDAWPDARYCQSCIMLQTLALPAPRSLLSLLPPGTHALCQSPFHIGIEARAAASGSSAHPRRSRPTNCRNHLHSHGQPQHPPIEGPGVISNSMASCLQLPDQQDAVAACAPMGSHSICQAQLSPSPVPDTQQKKPHIKTHISNMSCIP